MNLFSISKKQVFKYGHLVLHSGYLGAAASEMHGMYSAAAGGMLLMLWAGVLLGEGEGA